MFYTPKGVLDFRLKLLEQINKAGQYIYAVKPKKDIGCGLKHYKSFSESVPDNMETILGFTEYKHTEVSHYRILQCNECGKRAYLGGTHCMGTITANLVDDFIYYRIEIEELLEEFRNRGYRFKAYFNRINKQGD